MNLKKLMSTPKLTTLILIGYRYFSLIFESIVYQIVWCNIANSVLKYFGVNSTHGNKGFVDRHKIQRTRSKSRTNAKPARTNCVIGFYFGGAKRQNNGLTLEW